LSTPQSYHSIFTSKTIASLQWKMFTPLDNFISNGARIEKWKFKMAGNKFTGLLIYSFTHSPIYFLYRYLTILNKSFIFLYGLEKIYSRNSIYCLYSSYYPPI